MSSFVLNLPNNYVEIERDEMEYVDGGWSIYVLSDNLRGLMGSSKAFKYAFGSVAINYSWTYLTTTTVIGGKLAAAITAAAATVTGPVAIGLGAVAGLGGAAAVWYLGNNRVFY